MILEHAYATLKRTGLVATHAQFSAAYLNRSPRYFGDLLCSRRLPAVGAMLSLFVRCRAIAEAFAATPPLATQAAEMSALADAVWAELERRCCSLLPAGRARRAAAGASSAQ